MEGFGGKHLNSVRTEQLALKMRMLKPRRPRLAAVLSSHDQGACLKVIANNFIKLSIDWEAWRAFKKPLSLSLSRWLSTGSPSSHTMVFSASY